MYATKDDMITRFGIRQINELESMHHDGELSTDKALIDATHQINSYLSVRYITPVVGSEFLTVIACNIARYRLYMNDSDGEVQKRYDEAIAWLKDVANGKANVTYATPLTAQEIQKTTVRPVAPVGASHKGGVFGDNVFAKLPRP
ncbi:DUF1320 domain-containing protein [Moraxella bovis]|uniref:DUF1320 domain-containing protein n=1 Tax=Moraxella bovis TaxID=476 RepID=A0AAX3EQX0_MORBO|nr:DUF1320 domain-containing protein [Moraxella bovis]UYZ69969.1 DUF1320 domain-containing protein [Moraxella bovis]UYZ79565.1 DUF1320 domain-containing protein [Moraxella bovis]UYZ79837.1 DUF1320 domain-containing protein [Moraxella bovis]UYZ88047.1 DUF1320 domain-containing protein [Moraxella bovis]UYZ90774.1 DUF1320 domain-containing protein [Moraxella bovis]